jgi:hypothetical protein
MAPSARTRTRWHKAHAPRASAAATSVRESRNTASRRASASRHPPSRVVAAKLETAGYGERRRRCFFCFHVVLHLVDRQDAIADHLCKEEARTVACQACRPRTEGAVNGKTVHSDILITGAHKHSSAALPGQARGPGNRTPSISLARTIVRRNGRRMKSVLTGGIKNPQALTGALKGVARCENNDGLLVRSCS